jgi:hypothetical protein
MSKQNWTGDLRCQQEARHAGIAYPRTCQLCGLGPCKIHLTPDPIPEIRLTKIVTPDSQVTISLSKAQEAELIRMVLRMANENVLALNREG